MTKREMYNMIATINADNAEIVEFCKHEVALLDARKGGSKSPTKNQKENIGIMETILEVLAGCDEPVTVSELQKRDERLDYTNQRLSALLKKLVDEKKVIKAIVKGKSLFSIA